MMPYKCVFLSIYSTYIETSEYNCVRLSNYGPNHEYALNRVQACILLHAIISLETPESTSYLCS